MEKIHHQKHTRETLFFCISRLLEKTSYYGLRSILLLYMLSDAIKMSETNALTVYGWFASSFLISQIIGALFGDLLIGNKKAIIIGGILQALGAFILCIPSTIGLYTGLSLVTIGNGLYTPNIIASFGKSYLNKTKLLDSGFTLFRLMVNIGAFFGTILISFISVKFNFTFGFILTGILMLLSIIPILISTDQSLTLNTETVSSTKRRILLITSMFLITGIFWGIYDFTSIRSNEIQMYLINNKINGLPAFFRSNFNFIFSIPLSIIAILIWRYYYSSSILKLTIGFIFGCISICLLFFIPQIPLIQHTFLFFIIALFLAISELYVSPVLFTILTKYSNPKYLAILISLYNIPIRFLSLLLVFESFQINPNSYLGLKIGLIVSIIISIGLIVFLILNKKTKTIE